MVLLLGESVAKDRRPSLPNRKKKGPCGAARRATGAAMTLTLARVRREFCPGPVQDRTHVQAIELSRYCQWRCEKNKEADRETWIMTIGAELPLWAVQLREPAGDPCRLVRQVKE